MPHLGKYAVENGTPQGSVLSSTLFYSHDNDIFSRVPSDMERSLFADDGALWKRGRNGEYIIRELQDSVRNVER